MECLPKLYDIVDSWLFELRLLWLGRAGGLARAVMLLAAVAALCVYSEAARYIGAIVAGSFVTAELLAAAWRRRWSHTPRAAPDRAHV